MRLPRRPALCTARCPTPTRRSPGRPTPACTRSPPSLGLLIAPRPVAVPSPASCSGPASTSAPGRTACSASATPCIAAVLGGARILYGALDSLFAGRLGADLALALACIAAILIGEPLVAAEVVFIGLAGECLEACTFARTQRGIRKLVEVFPRKCWLLRDGQEVAGHHERSPRRRPRRRQAGQEGPGRRRGRRRPVDGRYQPAHRREPAGRKGRGDEVLAGCSTNSAC